MSVLRCRSLTALAVLTAIFVAGLGGAVAAVTAEVDSMGNYVRTLIITRASASEQHVWSSFPGLGGPGMRMLNPTGDANGDMWPAMVHDPSSNNYPWIVWSRFNGRDYDLGWSRWIGQGWQKVDWVEQESRLGDDLDPNIDINGSGRPFVVWWSDEGGVGRVYLSIYLDSRWMQGRLVSDAELDSRFPTMQLNEDGSVIVTFDTAEGPQSKLVAIEGGASINDGLDPVNNISVEDYELPTSLDGNQ